MVLASVYLQQPQCTMETGQIASSAQCTLSDLALYRLPTNIRPESGDFENLLLQCVENNLACRHRNEDQDLAREMVCGLADSDSQLSLACEQLNFVVCIEPNRLLLTAVKSAAHSDGGKFNLAQQHSCMQICFSEIKLCYVNIQLPNIVIWLLSSIPQKIVKNESPAAKCGNQQVRPKCLYALIWKCLREHDVVNLRQVYKHLRSFKKLHPCETLLSKLVSPSEKHHSEQEMQTSKVPLGDAPTSKSLKSVTSKPSHQMLTRQRQPAKLIHDNALFSQWTTLERKLDSSNLSHKKVFANSIRPFVIQSASEFDTTQMTNYLSQNGTKSCKSSTKVRTRSRSVESPRHRFRMVYKPINDDIELLIPSCHVSKCDSLSKCDKLNENDKDKKSKGYSDSLNSEGSSLSDESSSGEYVPSSLEYEYFSLSKLSNADSATKSPIVIKSVLKKSSSYFEGQKNARVPRSCFFLGSSSLGERKQFSSDNRNGKSRQCANLHSKKNVTFSAYATIQVVDN